MDRKTRKELKRRGKRSLRLHYFLFVAACLLAAFFAAEAEFRSTLTFAQMQAEPGLSTGGRQVSLQNVWENMPTVDQMRQEAADLNLQAAQSAQGADPAFGRTRGVLAGVVNQLSSGSILITLAAAAASLLGSPNAGVLALVVLGAALFFAFWFFVQNVYAVVLRRLFLEGHLYPDVPFQRFAYLLRIRRWTRASLTMFVKYVFLTLWSLTVVGAAVKRYSYYLVPWIVAENPSLPPREAITLSRRMMNGHKWECFCLEVTFLGWMALGQLTFGLTDLFFANPYRVAFFTEYYVKLRAEAKAADLAGAGELNDTYLYEKPSEALLRRHYGDVFELLEHPPVALEGPGGWKGFLARNFGVLVFPSANERQYEQDQARRLQAEQLFGDVQGREYPARLYPIPETERQALAASLHYLRHYSVWSLLVLFFSFSIVGWVWEVSLHLVTHGEFVNRGSLHGPWLPIYGAGAVLILVLLNRLRAKPLAEFLAAVALSGVVEYTTSLVMELASGGVRWWDYSGYFLNLNGRICAEGLLVFGLGGMAVVYLLAPLVDNALERFQGPKLRAACLVLLAVFAFDAVYSQFVPNVGEGITDALPPAGQAQPDADP